MTRPRVAELLRPRRPPRAPPQGAAAFGPRSRSPRFRALHVPLALLVDRIPLAGTIHALVSLAVGLAWAASARPARAAYAAAYICGAEVLWRMTSTGIYWEFAKYAVAAIFLVAVLRAGRLRGPAPALAYFALLLPGAWITFEKSPFGNAVNDVSFNLSGPLAIMASVLFFSRLNLSLPRFRGLLLAAAAPIVGASVLVWRGVLQSTNVAFGGSNVTLSGGFAPNQVSSMLGLGVLLVGLALLSARTGLALGGALLGLLLVFATQSAMTFSRGGLYLAGTSLLVAALSLVRDRPARRRLALGGAVVAALAAFVIVPRLLSFTGGAIALRFAETSTTGRAEIVEADIDTWLGSPVLGVGAGRAKQNRGRFFRPEASHTEFTRLLAEHGCGLLRPGASRRWRSRLRAPSSASWALRAALLTWAVLFMSIDGVRLAAPCLAFGIALVSLDGAPAPARAAPRRPDPLRERSAAAADVWGSVGVHPPRIDEDAREGPW